MEPYDEAHLFVAAIRVALYQKQSPPTIDEVCSILNISVEAGLSTCRSLKQHDIIDISEDPFSIKLTITNHLEIEQLPRKSKEENSLAKELEQFKAKKKDMDKKVDAIKADLKKKREDMHNSIEEKLRKEVEKIKKNN
jgi:hypothetical protein